MKNIICILFFLLVSFANGQTILSQKFDTITMTFKGSKTEQAMYLLRYVKKYAELGENLKELPPFLNQILSGKKKVVSVKTFKKYLKKIKIDYLNTGGNIDLPVSKSENKILANYFVIHDASNFVKNDSTDTFPSNVNDADYRSNKLEFYKAFEHSHVFVNRLGESMTCNDFNKAIRATKFENKKYNPTLGGKAIGNFIHIELIQPRMADKGKKNDAIAILPGFTDAQYQKLALLYFTASVRKGDWLVPTFHAVLDQNFEDGHDDPQHFELEKFVFELEKCFNDLKNQRK